MPKPPTQAVKKPPVKKPQPPAPETHLEVFNKLAQGTHAHLGSKLNFLAGDEHPDLLLGAVLGLRDLPPPKLEALRRQIDGARQRAWLREHRLALALRLLAAPSTEAAIELVTADGVPDVPVLTRLAAWRVLESSHANGQS